MSLDGKTIVFTGTLATPRAEATRQAREAGATVTGAVSGKTNILVAGEGAGAKIASAQSKGVEIWTEDEFLAALSGKKKRASKAKAEPAAKKAKAAPVKKEPAAKKPRGKAAAAAAAAAAEEEEEEEAPAPAKKAVKKEAVKKEAAAATPAAGGGGPKVRKPDRHIANGSNYTVMDDYDVKLMQTNIHGGNNNNKFYIIQALAGMGRYHVHYRWGRLGEEGKWMMDSFSDKDGAVKFFEKKFRDKTKNAWSARNNFVKHNDKYQLVEVADDDDGGDVEGAALGKLSQSQIEKGQAVLAELRQGLANGAGKAQLATLSSAFYSLIPTTSGRVKPPPLDNEAALTEKEGLLEFWLRMGFESVVSTEQLGSPLEGVRELPIPKTLQAAASNVSDSSSINSSRTRGAQLSKSKAGGPVRPMDAELYGAIMLYTGNSIYRKINQVLRENWNGVKPYRNYLRLYLEAMSCLPAKKVTLWRGIAADLFDSYTEGSVQTWWSISSCTAAKSVAEGFMQQLGGKATLLTLECESAVDVSALSFYPHEKESLLLPGTQLKVLSRVRKGNVAHIHVQEVGLAD